MNKSVMKCYEQKCYEVLWTKMLWTYWVNLKSLNKRSCRNINTPRLIQNSFETIKLTIPHTTTCNVMCHVKIFSQMV